MLPQPCVPVLVLDTTRRANTSHAVAPPNQAMLALPTKTIAEWDAFWTQWINDSADSGAQRRFRSVLVVDDARLLTVVQGTLAALMYESGSASVLLVSRHPRRAAQCVCFCVGYCAGCAASRPTAVRIAQL